MFHKAIKSQLLARVLICGPTGSGKTYTALTLARALAGPSGRVALLDTERKSASLYADLFDFDTCNIDSFEPDKYVKAIRQAEEAGYKALVIDSLSHAWDKKGGILDQLENIKARKKSDNSFVAWREATPMHNNLVDAMLQSGLHIVATARSKMEYVLEENERGKKIPRKVGLAPVQRDGLEYEFTLGLDMDLDHRCVVNKSRCHAIADAVWTKPTVEDFKPFVDFLGSGDPEKVEEPRPAEASMRDKFSQLLDSECARLGIKTKDGVDRLKRKVGMDAKGKLNDAQIVVLHGLLLNEGMPNE